MSKKKQIGLKAIDNIQLFINYLLTLGFLVLKDKTFETIFFKKQDDGTIYTITLHREVGYYFLKLQINDNVESDYFENNSKTEFIYNLSKFLKYLHVKHKTVFFKER
ncbi:hypothetical protein [Romboutsia sp.]|uniref:hypothetical protein n=1 Tax=Romboutsia sp. TaxID=1965302 RepID=UPI002C5DDA34|nr:hypothetical protein [Romboutsia sp.]HSQ89142.1 hypothetical protein [Romboutsia sp.]